MRKAKKWHFQMKLTDINKHLYILSRSARNSRSDSISRIEPLENKRLLFENEKPEVPILNTQTPKAKRKLKKKMKIVKKTKSKKKKKHHRKIIKDDLWKKKQSLIEKYITHKKYPGGNLMTLDTRYPQNSTLNEYDFARNQQFAKINHHDFSSSMTQHRRISSESNLYPGMTPDFDNNILASDPFGRLTQNMGHSRRLTYTNELQRSSFMNVPNLNNHKPPLNNFKRYSIPKNNKLNTKLKLTPLAEESSPSMTQHTFFHSPGVSTFQRFKNTNKRMNTYHTGTLLDEDNEGPTNFHTDTGNDQRSTGLK